MATIEVDGAALECTEHGEGEQAVPAEHPELVHTLVLPEPPVITLFVSNDPRPVELFRLLFSRPRTAAAIVKFGASHIMHEDDPVAYNREVEAFLSRAVAP